MTKRQHPADAADEIAQIAAIRSATHFLASLFVGRGKFEKVEGATCFEAIRAGAALRASKGGGGPDCLVYAIQPDGRAVFIARATIEKLTAQYFGRNA